MSHKFYILNGFVLQIHCIFLAVKFMTSIRIVITSTALDEFHSCRFGNGSYPASTHLIL